MCIQTPGSFVWVGSLAARLGWAGWSTWGIYLVTGCLQGMLLVMAISFEIRDRRQQKKAGRTAPNGPINENSQAMSSMTREPACCTPKFKQKHSLVLRFSNKNTPKESKTLDRKGYNAQVQPLKQDASPVLPISRRRRSCNAISPPGDTSLFAAPRAFLPAPDAWKVILMVWHNSEIDVATILIKLS